MKIIKIFDDSGGVVNKVSLGISMKTIKISKVVMQISSKNEWKSSKSLMIQGGSK